MSNEEQLEMDAIVASRPPDRVRYGDWEPYGERTIERMVPVDGSLLRGFTYEKRVHTEPTGWRRGRYEYWDIPATMKVVSRLENVTARVFDPEVDDVDWDATTATIEETPDQTIGRKIWEYR